MDFLVEDKLIDWKGSLKSTYDAYLHPDVLEYENKDMWESMGRGEIIDLFQFETMVGQQAVQKVQPHSLLEMAVANTLMRLKGDEDDSPLDKFARHKKNIQLWYDEMDRYNLTQDEISTLEEYFKHKYGIGGEQEDVMKITMDKRVASFTMKEANKIRKGIAKKKKEVIEECKNMFFNRGKDNGVSDNMLNYVWDMVITPQLGYSFSINHTVPYSAIGLQELNLYQRFPKIYWNSGVLTVNAGYAGEEDDLEEEDESDSEEENELGEDEDEVEEGGSNPTKKKKKATKYGKIAKAITNIRGRGVVVALPNINNSSLIFKPHIESDTILFGLKGIIGVGDDLIEEIINNRPYSSIEDFLSKVKVRPVQAMALAKAGCFDDMIGGREKVGELLIYLTNYFGSQTKKLVVVNMKNFPELIRKDLIPIDKNIYKRYYRYREYIKPFLKDGYYHLNNIATPFFEEHFAPHMKQEDIIRIDEYPQVLEKGFKKIYDKYMSEIKGWVSSQETLKLVNLSRENEFTQEIRDKFIVGELPRWEMSSLNMYYTEHELSSDRVDYEKNNLTQFLTLPEEPTVEQKGRWKLYSPIAQICGTVIDKDKNKHLVYLQTTDGVVSVKLHKGLFSNYDKQISEPTKDKKGKIVKKVIEKSWFTKGTMLAIVGYRNGDYFFPKKYKGSIYQHTIRRIEEVLSDGRIIFKSERGDTNEC